MNKQRGIFHTPSQPPNINIKILWLTLLGPLVVASITFGLMMLDSINLYLEPWGSRLFFIFVVACWINFHRCLKTRFRGTSLILLTIAYPIFQVILLGSVFLAGCFLIASQSGGFL